MPCPRLILAALLLVPAASIFAQAPLPPEPDFNPCQAVEQALADGSLFKPLAEIKSVLSTDGQRMPQDCSVLQFVSQVSGSESRFYRDIDYYWRPTDFFHMPAYFDDVPLERYGQTKFPRLQPVVSGTKFILQLPVVPYKIGVDRPHDCISTLGHRPPGDCVPCIRQRLPKELDAAFLQAASTVGLVFLLP